ncbi:MAG: DUF4149 domain-containing protein [Acidobacteria bacterium]|nr:DUF4149 domain-containing protein [Acidobacteriota bacterium]MBI3421517.1 DUF4149 domain-containing protein [Acidobacteriota bacterium]
MTAKLRLAIVSLWLGLMLMFSVGVAPAAFSVLKDQQRKAGDIVNLALGGAEIAGIICGLLLLLLLFISKEQRGKLFNIEALLLALMTLAMLVSKFVVSAKLHAMRAEFGETLQTMAASEPAKVAFNQLHQYSVWLMSFAILAALVLIVLLVRATPAAKTNHA